MPIVGSSCCLPELVGFNLVAHSKFYLWTGGHLAQEGRSQIDILVWLALIFDLPYYTGTVLLCIGVEMFCLEIEYLYKDINFYLDYIVYSGGFFLLHAMLI
jgi:hypothetical protein